MEESRINQTLNTNLDVWYFVWALLHLHKVLEEVCEDEIKPEQNITHLNLC